MIRQRVTRRGGRGVGRGWGPCGRPLMKTCAPVAGEEQDTTGTHEGPHSTPLHTCPYAIPGQVRSAEQSIYPSKERIPILCYEASSTGHCRRGRCIFRILYRC